MNTLIHYLYNFSYSETENTAAGIFSTLCFHVQMCIIADKYDIKHLKARAIDLFTAAAKGKAKTSEFAGAASQAYEASTVTRGICDAIVTIGVEEKALSSTSGADSALRKIMEATPESAVDYATFLEGYPKRLSKAAHRLEKRFCCPSCDHEFVCEVPPASIFCFWCGREQMIDVWLRHISAE